MIELYHVTHSYMEDSVFEDIFFFFFFFFFLYSGSYVAFREAIVC